MIKTKMTIEKILLQFKPEKSDLLPTLKEIQKEFGYVSKDAIDQCADFFKIKAAEVYSAASFYDDIEFDVPVSVSIQVCDSANCHSKGADNIVSEIERLTGVRAGDDNKRIKLKRRSCFGLCSHGPIMKVNETVFEKMSPSQVDDILSPYLGQGNSKSL